MEITKDTRRNRYIETHSTRLVEWTLKGKDVFKADFVAI